MAVVGFFISAVSFVLNFFAMVLFGIFNGDDLTIINTAIMSAMFTICIVSGYCATNWKYSWKLKLVVFLLLFIPFFTVACYLILDILYPGSVLPLIFRYIYATLYTVIGIIPSIILNILYKLLIDKYETIAVAVMVIGIIVLSVLEGSIIGGYITRKWKAPATGPKATIVDGNGNEYRVY